MFPFLKFTGKRELLMTLLDNSTWSPSLKGLVESSQVTVRPYQLNLDYDYWNYRMYVY